MQQLVAGWGFEWAAVVLGAKPAVTPLGDEAVEGLGHGSGKKAQDEEESPWVGHAGDEGPEGGWTSVPVFVVVCLYGLMCLMEYMARQISLGPGRLSSGVVGGWLGPMCSELPFWWGLRRLSRGLPFW